MQDSGQLSIRLEDERGTGRGFLRRRRNRHGRGLRGALLPPTVPGALSRAERFDEWVMDAADRLDQMWGKELGPVEYLVADIPDKLDELAARGDHLPLGSCVPASGKQSAVVTLYRRPIHMAANGYVQVSELIHDVVVEQAASLLGMAPEDVDPSYGRFHE